jgi:hypothetical protein
MPSKLEDALKKLALNTKEYKSYEKGVYEKFINVHNDPVLRKIAQNKTLGILKGSYPEMLNYTGNGFTAYYLGHCWQEAYFEEKKGLLVVKLPKMQYELFELFPKITPEELESRVIDVIERLPVYKSTKSYWR